MNVIFLDIDGVLNIQSETYNSHSYENIGNDTIEPHLMKRLEYLLDRVGSPLVVLSSSWRLKQLKRKLAKQRFKYLGLIEHRTSREKDLRGEQINDFLIEYSWMVSDYVVLEDEVSDVCGAKCNIIPVDKVVEVDMNEGLSNKDVINTIIRLNGLDQYNDTSVLYKMNETNYDKFYSLGYRPDKGCTIEKLEERWENFTLDNKCLSMSFDINDRKEIDVQKIKKVNG